MNETNMTASPLSWPAGYQRTESQQRRKAKFGEKAITGGLKNLTISQAVDRLKTAVRRFSNGLTYWRIHPGSVVISTNLPARADGVPYSDNRFVNDPGVAVYFTFDERPTVMACDKWSTVADNIAAIASTLEAMRALERYGVAECERAFTGFAALPAPGDVQARTCWVVLGIAPTQSKAAIDEAWRERAKSCHPDRPGGSHDAMSELNTARDQATLQATQP